MVTKRANGIATGSTPATTAAASRARRRRDDVSGKEPEQRDQRERREVEHVALLDAQRLLRREGRHLGHEQQSDRQRRGRKRACARRETTRREPQREQRGETEHAEVEVELGDVAEQIAADGGDRVLALGRGPIGAEQRERRAAAGRGRRDAEHDRPAGDAVEHREPPQARRRPRSIRPSRSGATRAARRARPPARASRSERTDGEQHHLPPPGRPLEREHEHEHGKHEERVERVLGHQRAGVEHRRHEQR